jgi:hypothetical protein
MCHVRRGSVKQNRTPNHRGFKDEFSSDTSSQNFLSHFCFNREISPIEAKERGK